MSITYVEKGAGLHQAIVAAGYRLEERDGNWIADNEPAVQAIINAYDLEDARERIVALIKDEARARIVSFLPEWKQSNMNARMNELNEARFSRTLTTAESAEVEAMRAVWTQVKLVRAASNAHEAAVNALGTFAAIEAYPWKTTGWPAV